MFDQRAQMTPPSTPPIGSTRTRSGRVLRTGLVVVATMLASCTALIVAGAGPSSASTLNGVATTAVPDGLSFLGSGGSDTQFALSLPSGAACSGDTAHDGYTVWSYLVQPSATIGVTTFSEAQGPSQGYGLFDSTGTYVGPLNTATNTGQITQVPDFEWGPAVSGNSLLSALLYSGTSGVWEGGLACTNSSGVVTDNWNVQFTFTADSSDPNGFTWTAVPGPEGDTLATITSANNATFAEGSDSSFTPTGAGTPTPTITESGPLPAGVSFSGGVLSGDPTVTGTFPITFTATNGIGNPATQSFTLTAGSAPAITSNDGVGFTTGTSGTFTVTTSGFPTPSLSETGASLPEGVTFVDNGNGTATLSGAPGTGSQGTYDLSITATNGIAPDATQSFTLTVSALPDISSTDGTTFTVGQAGTFEVDAGGDPTPAITETGSLPDGLNFVDNGNGTATLAGTPDAATGGSYQLDITASNGVGAGASQTFTLTVDQPSLITSANSTTFSHGVAGSFTVTASGYPTPTISEWGNLPAGVTFADGVLSGTPTVSGTFELVFIADNGVESASIQEFTLTILALNISTTSVPAATVGTPYSQQLNAVGGTTPYAWKVTAGVLPKGLTLSKSGLLSGTVKSTRHTPTPGPYPFTVTVTDHTKKVHETATANYTLELAAS